MFPYDSATCVRVCDMTARCCCFCICVFAVLLNKACLQVTLEGKVRGSVVLPCFYTVNSLKIEDVTIYWRHNSSHNVYDIIEGKASVEKQGAAYKNRAETFPNEYMKGNFSLKLSNLQYNDAGKYVCYITKAHQNPSTQLLVKDRGNHGAATRAEKTVPFFILLYILQYN
ncbi:CD276 antigen homolog [Labeo rohita]|uniref:CD276 antigen homolog n=1 Tax=Labeo rohita TaxID=84645 RepID=UPI0021E1E477|nr:CD276 antigen homolog [Labeo rohita]